MPGSFSGLIDQTAVSPELFEVGDDSAVVIASVLGEPGVLLSSQAEFDRINTRQDAARRPLNLCPEGRSPLAASRGATHFDSVARTRTNCPTRSAAVEARGSADRGGLVGSVQSAVELDPDQRAVAGRWNSARPEWSELTSQNARRLRSGRDERAAADRGRVRSPAAPPPVRLRCDWTDLALDCSANLFAPSLGIGGGAIHDRHAR